MEASFFFNGLCLYTLQLPSIRSSLYGLWEASIDFLICSLCLYLLHITFIMIITTCRYRSTVDGTSSIQKWQQEWKTYNKPGLLQAFERNMAKGVAGTKLGAIIKVSDGICILL